MVNEVNYSDYGTEINLLTTELNALADGSTSAFGPTYAQDTNKDQFFSFELEVDFVSAPDDGGYCEVEVYVSKDGGTTYPTMPDRVFRIKVDAVTSAQVLPCRHDVTIPPGEIKVKLKNKSGQAFPATGSVLNGYPYNNEIQ